MSALKKKKTDVYQEAISAIEMGCLIWLTSQNPIMKIVNNILKYEERKIYTTE